MRRKETTEQVKELARTNDMVRMSFLRALLTDAGIERFLADYKKAFG